MAKKKNDEYYTPEKIYKAVSDYVSTKYNVDAKRFIRPFFPGGDYEKYDYTSDCIVVDNPPFSILNSIVNFYNDRDIKYFLFVPSSTLINATYLRNFECCVLFTGNNIKYENGESIRTSFITNLEEPKIKTEPKLYQLIEEVSGIQKLDKKEYPENLLYAPCFHNLAENGEELCIEPFTVEYKRKLDCMKNTKTATGKSPKEIFGGGLLVGDDIWNKYIEANKRILDKNTYKLSDDEKLCIRELNKR